MKEIECNQELKMNTFNSLSEQDLFEVHGGMPFLLGVLAAAGIVAGSAIVVGGATYGVKKLCEFVGSKF